MPGSNFHGASHIPMDIPRPIGYPRGVEHDPHDLGYLVGIMQRLLALDGCPWDREQTLETLIPFLLEETYEVVEAIHEGIPEHHREELGDLLFQIVFQAALAGHAMADIIRGIGEKLIRRHPHVFGDGARGGSPDVEQVLLNWEQIKQQERAAARAAPDARAGGAAEPHSARGLLDGIPRAMPALPRAQRLSARAAKVGFDWPDTESVRAKVAEELDELDEAAATKDPAQMQHELGDLLFALVNWARKSDIDPEEALRQANQRFVRRFGHIESELARQNRSPGESTLEEMEALWQQAKQLER